MKKKTGSWNRCDNSAKQVRYIKKDALFGKLRQFQDYGVVGVMEEWRRLWGGRFGSGK